MSIQIPHQLKELINGGGIKKAFITDPTGANGRNCLNCAGVGIMYLFLAHEGPYKSPSTDLSKVSHFFDGAWWVGSSYSANCPVCHGQGQIKTNGR